MSWKPRRTKASITSGRSGYRRIGLLNGQVGYRFPNGWRIQLDGFNLLNSHSDQITYAYGSLLKSDSLFGMCFPATALPTAPVTDRVLHPVEPLALRLTLAGQF